MRRFFSYVAALSLVGLVFLIGCVGDGTLEEVDPDAAPEFPTWTEHVYPIMETRCNSCHAPDAQPGELEGFGFDTCAKTKARWRPLWETIEDGSMPPGAAYRVTSSEALTLERWREQGSTCD